MLFSCRADIKEDAICNWVGSFRRRGIRVIFLVLRKATYFVGDRVIPPVFVPLANFHEMFVQLKKLWTRRFPCIKQDYPPWGNEISYVIPARSLATPRLTYRLACAGRRFRRSALRLC